MDGLAATFRSHAKARCAPAEDDALLEGLLSRAWETSRERWPTVALPAEAFVTHLARRLPQAAAHAPLGPLLAELSLAELYLACACLQGLSPAIQAFEEHYLARLPALLRTPHQSDSMIEDACQLVRMKLLVAPPGSAPKLAEYTGRGALLSWVRVTAVRTALKLRAGEKPAPPEDPDIILRKFQAPGRHPEGDLIQQRHQADFRQAMREAFSTLSSEERHLLRLYFVDQLSMYELAALFRVNQATISRRLKDVRQRIYKETQRHLAARLGLSPRDFTSFIRVLDSQLDLSISQLVGEDDAVPGPPRQG